MMNKAIEITTRSRTDLRGSQRLGQMLEGIPISLRLGRDHHDLGISILTLGINHVVLVLNGLSAVFGFASDLWSLLVRLKLLPDGLQVRALGQL